MVQRRVRLTPAQLAAALLALFVLLVLYGAAQAQMQEPIFPGEGMEQQDQNGDPSIPWGQYLGMEPFECPSGQALVGLGKLRKCEAVSSGDPTPTSATPTVTPTRSATPTPTLTVTPFVCPPGFALDRAHPEACVQMPTPGAGGPTPTSATPTATPTRTATPTPTLTVTPHVCPSGEFLDRAHPEGCQPVPTPGPGGVESLFGLTGDIDQLNANDASPSTGHALDMTGGWKSIPWTGVTQACDAANSRGAWWKTNVGPIVCDNVGGTAGVPLIRGAFPHSSWSPPTNALAVWNGSTDGGLGYPLGEFGKCPGGQVSIGITVAGEPVCVPILLADIDASAHPPNRCVETDSSGGLTVAAGPCGTGANPTATAATPTWTPPPTATPTTTPTPTTTATTTPFACPPGHAVDELHPAGCVELPTPVATFEPWVTPTPTATGPPTPTVTVTPVECGPGKFLSQVHPEECDPVPTFVPPTPTVTTTPTPTVTTTPTPTVTATPTVTVTATPWPTHDPPATPTPFACAPGNLLSQVHPEACAPDAEGLTAVFGLTGPDVRHLDASDATFDTGDRIDMRLGARSIPYVDNGTGGFCGAHDYGLVVSRQVPNVGAPAICDELWTTGGALEVLTELGANNHAPQQGDLTVWKPTTGQNWRVGYKSSFTECNPATHFSFGMDAKGNHKCSPLPTDEKGIEALQGDGAASTGGTMVNLASHSGDAVACSAGTCSMRFVDTIVDEFGAEISAKPRHALLGTGVADVVCTSDPDTSLCVFNAAGQFTLSYTWSTNNAASDPGAGVIKKSAGNDTVYISDFTSTGVDIGGIFERMAAGDGLSVAENDDASRFARFTLNGDPIDQGGWHALPVVLNAEGGGLRNNRGVEVIVLVLGTDPATVPTATPGAPTPTPTSTVGFETPTPTPTPKPLPPGDEGDMFQRDQFGEVVPFRCEDNEKPGWKNNGTGTPVPTCFQLDDDTAAGKPYVSGGPAADPIFVDALGIGAGGTNNPDLTASPAGRLNCTEDRGQGLKIYSDCLPTDVEVTVPAAESYFVSPQAGTDADDCGNALKPCKTATGPLGAHARIEADGRVGFHVCTNDATIGCGVCSGDGTTPCNEHEDCAPQGNGVCTAHACIDDGLPCTFTCTGGGNEDCTTDAHCPYGESCGTSSTCASGGATSCAVANPRAACGNTGCTTSFARAEVVFDSGAAEEATGPCDPDSAFCLSRHRCEGGSNPGAPCNITNADCIGDKDPHPCCTGAGTGNGDCSAIAFCLGGGTCSDSSNACNGEDPTNRCSSRVPGNDITYRGVTKDRSTLVTNIDATNVSADQTRGIVHDWSNRRHLAAVDLGFNNAGRNIATLGGFGSQAISFNSINVNHLGGTLPEPDHMGSRWDGMGTATILHENVLWFSFGNATGQSVRDVGGPGRVCMNNPNKSCTCSGTSCQSAAACGGTPCADRFCYHDPRIPCAQHTDCTPPSGVAGWCTPNQKSLYGLGASSQTSSDRIIIDNSWMQPGSLGGWAYEKRQFGDDPNGPAPDSNFNYGMRTAHIQVARPAAGPQTTCDCDGDGFGDITFGMTTCASQPECEGCGGGTGEQCAALPYGGMKIGGGEYWVASVDLMGSFTTGSLTEPEDSIYLTGTGELDILGPFAYDATTRTCDGTGGIVYQEDGRSGGGSMYLGALDADPSSCNQDGEFYTLTTDVNEGGAMRLFTGGQWNYLPELVGEGLSNHGELKFTTSLGVKRFSIFERGSRTVLGAFGTFGMEYELDGVVNFRWDLDGRASLRVGPDGVGCGLLSSDECKVANKKYVDDAIAAIPPSPTLDSLDFTLRDPTGNAFVPAQWTSTYLWQNRTGEAREVTEICCVANAACSILVANVLGTSMGTVACNIGNVAMACNTSPTNNAVANNEWTSWSMSSCTASHLAVKVLHDVP